MSTPEFKPRNPRFRERVEESFAQQPLQKTMGTRLAKVDAGYCEVHLPFDEKLTQHHGYLHGGVYAMLADTAGGYAAYTLLGPSDSALTVEYKLNMLRSGEGELFIAKGQVIKPGKLLTIVKAEVYRKQGDEEILCVTSLQTIMNMIDVPDNSTV